MRNGFKFKYVSAAGQTLDLSGNGIDAHGDNLPSWSFEAIELNGRIAGLKKQRPQYTIPLIVVAADEQAGIAAKNALYEIPAMDIDRSAPGRLYLNDWYIEGYMTASEVTNFWQLKRAAQYELTFTATEPKWVRDTTANYEDTSGQASSGLDFPFDFPFDFGVSRNDTSVTNANYTDSPILLRIYGAATNPRVTIANNTYGLDLEIKAGEYVEIDGMSYTVTHVKANGEHVNAFGSVVGDFAKGSGSYIFQPVPAGDSEVTWNGQFRFDVVTHELRSEPRWS